MDNQWMKYVDDVCDYYDAGCSCSQSLLAGFASHWDMPLDLALRLAAPLGGGMCHMGEVCGAVSGALMVIGLHMGSPVVGDKAAKDAAYALGAVFMERFKARRGTVLCRELLACDISKPENLLRARETELFKRTCPHVVREAAEILAEVLDEAR